MIHHLKTLSHKNFRFEWHETKKIVYLIRIGAVPEFGQAIAVNVEDHGAAYNTVLIWLRGYKEAKQELQNVQDKRLVA